MDGLGVGVSGLPAGPAPAAAVHLAEDEQSIHLISGLCNALIWGFRSRFCNFLF